MSTLVLQPSPLPKFTRNGTYGQETGINLLGCSTTIILLRVKLNQPEVWHPGTALDFDLPWQAVKIG